MSGAGLPGAGMTVQQADRRFLALTALRWLPVGITIPTMVLLALSRGLSLAEVGAIFLAHSALVALLELPTGGLADAVGRRPVLIASGLLHATSCLLYAGADSVPGFLAATCVLGVSRALDSGPLEAWYVDAAHAADPDADVVRGLSRAGVADCLALALGAVAGGSVPTLLDSPTALALPYYVGAGLSLVSVVAVALLVTSVGPVRETSARRAVLDGTRAVPRTVSGALGLAGRDAGLRQVLLLAAVCGYGLSTLELLGPGLFRTLAGSAAAASGVFGVVMALSFVAGAVGAALATRARTLAGATPRAVGALTGLCALTLVLAGLAPTVVLTGLAFAAFYLCNSAWWPLARGVLHDRVGAAQRATMLSGVSLTLQAGGAVSSVVSPQLGSTRNGFLVAGALTLVSAMVALRLPADRARVPVR